MSNDQDSRGFLPPITTVFTDEHHRQPPSSSATPTVSGTNPHHLPGFTILPLPEKSPATTEITSNVTCTTQETDLAAAVDRAIFKIRDVVAAATRPTTVDNPIRRTKSDTTSCAYLKQPTTTAKRHPLRRTVSDSVTLPPTRTRKFCSSSSSRHNVGESSEPEDSPQTKRLKKMEEMVTEIEQWCRDLRRENVEDDSPANVETKEGGEECEGEEECVGFNRLDDGALRIKMRCSCRKHFEILHNHIGCFYRLI